MVKEYHACHHARKSICMTSLQRVAKLRSNFFHQPEYIKPFGAVNLKKWLRSSDINELYVPRTRTKNRFMVFAVLSPIRSEIDGCSRNIA